MGRAGSTLAGARREVGSVLRGRRGPDHGGQGPVSSLPQPVLHPVAACRVHGSFSPKIVQRVQDQGRTLRMPFTKLLSTQSLVPWGLWCSGMGCDAGVQHGLRRPFCACHEHLLAPCHSPGCGLLRGCALLGPSGGQASDLRWKSWSRCPAWASHLPLLGFWGLGLAHKPLQVPPSGLPSPQSWHPEHLSEGRLLHPAAVLSEPRLQCTSGSRVCSAGPLGPRGGPERP